MNTKTLPGHLIALQVGNLRAVVCQHPDHEDDVLDTIAAQLQHYHATGTWVPRGSGEPALTDPDFATYIAVYQLRKSRWVRLTE